jgi:predicted phage-related endonuclease
MTFDRKTGIGGTDARQIMEGNWHPLWMEKTGRRPPVDLSDVFRVQLGRFTEEFHLDWVARKQGVTYRRPDVGDDMRYHDPANPWRYITLDGIDTANDVPIEVKHSHSAMRIREAADYYMPQLQHSLSITGKDWLWFSVIPGNEEPMTVRVDRSDEYIEKLIDLERSFWWHVKEDVAPEIVPKGKIATANALTDSILVGGYTAPVDMSTHNAWAALAAEYIELKPKVKRCDELNKEIKALIDPTWGGAFGHGLIVQRTKKGLTLRIDGETD